MNYWEKMLLSSDKAEEMLKNSTFNIFLGTGWENGQKIERWGTGFFFTEDGLALTAYHNLESDQSSTESYIFSAYYKGHKIALKWLKEFSSPSHKADIAVMKLDNPENVDIAHLQGAYLDPQMPLNERRKFWGGCAVCIYGYPIRINVQQGWRIDGAIDSSLSLIPILDNHGVEVERLNIHGSRIDDQLPGISGAAILDRHLGLVIGIQVLYDDETRQVCGTELGQLVSQYPELEKYFQKLPYEDLISQISKEVRDFGIDLDMCNMLVEKAKENNIKIQIIDIVCNRLSNINDSTERYWCYITLGKIGGEKAEYIIKNALSLEKGFALSGAQDAWKILCAEP